MESDYELPEGVRVHTFEGTGTAYDASQCWDTIEPGDVLWVPSEGVAGILVGAWPVAVTRECGAFHTVDPSVVPAWDWSRVGDLSNDAPPYHDYSVAYAVACALGGGDA